MSVAGSSSAQDEERTHPTEDILNTLRQLNSSQQGQGSSQQTDLQSQNSQRSEQDSSFASSPIQSEWDLLRAQVRENPRDADTWLKLVDRAEEGKDFDRENETYEALLEAFPNSVSRIDISVQHVSHSSFLQPQAQIEYIKHVLESSSPTKFQYAEGLFKRFLKTSPFVELWKYYLRYVQYDVDRS